MKIGDLVKFKGEDENDPHAAKGILVEIRNNIPPDHITGTHGVMWDFLVDSALGGNPIGWQKEHDIEVISNA